MSNTKKAIIGTKWTTISTGIATGLQFLQIAVLARLLDPAVFGLISVSTLIINFFALFANLGFTTSIIYKQENDKQVLSTLYLVNILLGVLFFFIIFFSAPLVVQFYHEPRLDHVIKISSSVFLIMYFGQIYSSLLQKELKFKEITITEIASSVTGTALTITLAYRGFEEYSLVFGGLTTQVLRTSLQVFFGRKLFFPRLYFKFSIIREHLRFGIFNIGEGVVYYVQSNLDNLLIGNLLGVKALGFYTVAYQLAVFPINKLNPIILQVASPIVAKMKDSDSDLRRAYIKILDVLCYFNLPLLAGLFITAESVIPLIYGPGWEETFPLIKIFVFVSIFNCLSHPIFLLVYSKGKPNLLFYINVVVLLIKTPLVYFLGQQGHVTYIALAYLIATFITFSLNLTVAYSLIGNFFKQFYENSLKTVTFCLLMVLAIAIYKNTVGYDGLFNTITQIAIGGMVYSLLTLRYKYSLAELKNLRGSF
ncbi:MOP flippase family protein [Nibrella saemangeumensis]|uniref:MOP flippase family protein n=1 Tax=Nibrella saemangeumensis TaxID=1084526 RepID=A0ABP8MH18_9BACT